MEAFLFISTLVVVAFTYILAGQVAVRTYDERWGFYRHSDLPFVLAVLGYLSLMIVWAKMMAEFNYRWLTHPRQVRAERKAEANKKHAEHLQEYALETEAIMLMINQPGKTLEDIVEKAYQIGKDSRYDSRTYSEEKRRELMAPIREISKRAS